MTTRSEFDPSLARNYYDLWGTYSDANELLYARVAELEEKLNQAAIVYDCPSLKP